MGAFPYDLIIFDCDGTLVDSEYLHNKLNSDVLVSLGLDEYTTERCIEDFAGSSWKDIKKEIHLRHNVDVPQELIDARIPKTLSMMEGNIKTIPDALGFVESVASKCKIAVGSNGEPPTVLKSLQIQGFMDYFEPANVYTKEDVQNGKPAPDLYFHVADRLGVPYERCLVLEDSVPGAQAGLAASMDVFGFVGVAHAPKEQEKKLREAGVNDIFHDFIHIREALDI